MDSPFFKTAHHRWHRGATAATLAVAVAVSLPGCGTPMVKADRPDDWAKRLELAETGQAGISSEWWRQWGDAALQDLLRQALADHPDLALAQARWERAQSLTAGAQADALPQAELNAQQNRQRFSEHGLFQGAPIAGKTVTERTLQVGAGWTPDLWGEQRAALSAAVGQAKAARAEQALAEQALTAQILRAAINLAHWSEQEKLLRQSVEWRSQWQDLVRQRNEAGLDTRQDLAEREGSALSEQARYIAAQEQIELSRHQLAALCGVSLQRVQDYHPTLDQFPDPPLPARLGLDLLGRRPDVVAARWRAQAAQSQVQVAQAQFYPSLHLGLFAGYDALKPEQLIESGNRQFGVLPALRLPLFEGGRLQAQLSDRQAQQRSAVAQYNQTVLAAVREAADALSSEQALSQQVQRQERSAGRAEQVWQLARSREEAGIGTRMNTLATQLARQEQLRLTLELRARKLSNHITLLKALGGGWEESATLPRTSQQVSKN
jgi:NodT family efflux transporter outer membrane factor (OMF) lipoprotein